MGTITTIPRESIAKFRFDLKEVLTIEEVRKERLLKLTKGLKLGNIYRRKVKITFKTKFSGMKKVEAAIWAVGNRYISLKGGVNIPISSISNIDFY